MQTCHWRGLNARARDYGQRALAIATETGIGLLRDTFRHSQAELFIRDGHYTESIELCRAMVAEDSPVFVKASVRLALSGAYSRAGDHNNAITEAKLSLDGFESVGAVAAASVAASAVANCLSMQQLPELLEHAGETLRKVDTE